MKKWTKKISDYGTNGYFVSPFYGEDLAQAPDYDEVTNPDGYGGPKHPLKSLEKFYQESEKYAVAIIDKSMINLSYDITYKTIIADNEILLKAENNTFGLSTYSSAVGITQINGDIRYASVDKSFLFNVLFGDSHVDYGVSFSVINNCRFVRDQTSNFSNNTIINHRTGSKFFGNIADSIIVNNNTMIEKKTMG